MNLQLSLKNEWFEMTKAGIKTEDYREINEYWYNRLVRKTIREERTFENFISIFDCMEPLSKKMIFNYFETNTMTLGYPKSTDTERILKFKHKGIEIRTGNPEWGAEPGKLYFVIKHGKKL